MCVCVCVWCQAGDIALHERWGERPEDDWRPTDMPTATATLHTATPIAPPPLSREAVSAALQAYLAFVESAPSLIRLPFVLRYKRGTAKSSGGNKLGSLVEGSVCLSSSSSAPFPRQIYALEMSFSASSNFVPISPIRIPYLSDGGGTGDAERFPNMFKLLLRSGRIAVAVEAHVCVCVCVCGHSLCRLQPIAPVPTSFNVSITFNDAEVGAVPLTHTHTHRSICVCICVCVKGQTYTGHLEAFFVTFQDMCLPPRAPPQLWAAFFEALWTAQHFMCRSVKVRRNLHTTHTEMVVDGCVWCGALGVGDVARESGPADRVDVGAVCGAVEGDGGEGGLRLRTGQRSTPKPDRQATHPICVCVCV